MIIGLDHIQLTMPPGGEDDAREFWTMIGFTEVEKPETLAARGGVWFALPDGRQLHYGVVIDFTRSRKAHPAFVVSDLDTLALYLMRRGQRVQWDDALAPRRRLYSTDPFGNRIEFLEAEEH